jgi:hypothetical protein
LVGPPALPFFGSMPGQPRLAIFDLHRQVIWMKASVALFEKAIPDLPFNGFLSFFSKLSTML